MPKGREGYYLYVRHHDVPARTHEGWELVDDMQGTPHGHYAVTMYWPFEGEPPKQE